MSVQTLIPTSVFCPRCGKSVKLAEMIDVQDIASLLSAEYSQGAKGTCGCGVVLVFLTKPMPEEPTFTILFNLYGNK